MTPEHEAIIIRETVAGVTQRNIAAQIGVSHVTVDRHQDRLRDHITRYAAELLNRGLRPAQRTVCRLAAAGNRPNADDATRKLALDASKVILAAAGIAGSAPSIIINTLIQVNAAPDQEQALRLLKDFIATKTLTNSIPAIDAANTIDSQASQSTIIDV